MLTNLATNPSFESAASGVVAVPGTSGAAALTNPAATTTFGSNVLHCQWSTASTAAGGGVTYDIPVTAGGVYSFGYGLVRSSIAQRLQMFVEWRTAAATISSSAAATQVAVAATAYVMKVENLTSPGTATIARVTVNTVAGTGYANWSIGSSLELDGLMANAGATLQSYFDGSTSGGYWTGTPNASTSVFPNTLPTLTVSTDPNPAARTLVVIPEVAPTATAVTMSRVAEGRTFKVRGGVNLFSVGGAQVMDYETPIGVPASYRAEMFDSTGLSLGFTLAASATVDPTAALGSRPGVRALISQPLKPQLAIACTILVDSAADILRKTPGDLYFAEGASVGTRIGGRRQGIVGMPFGVVCDTLADADEFQSMFGGYDSDFPAVILIRTAPGIRIPRVLFASVSGGPHEISYKSATTVTFAMTIDEVQPPSPGLVIPTLRRMDIDAAFTTRAARAAAYATRLQRDTDFTKAGLAG